MHTLTKVVISSSLVLGAALFSLGCGGGASCCDGNAPGIDNPPVSKIANLTANQTNTFPANQSNLVLNGNKSTDDKGVNTYEWVEVTCAQDFEDGTVVSTAKEYTVTNLPIAPAAKKVCLRVTDAIGQTNTTCHCVNKAAPAAPCRAPTPSLNVTDGNGQSVAAFDRSISSDTIPFNKYNLNCARSASNCAVDTENNLTCEWSAKSYNVIPAADGTVDCNSQPQTPYINDCFSSTEPGRGDNDHGLNTTTLDNNTFFRICSSGPASYRCIEIGLTVKDNMSRRNLSASTSRVFPVSITPRQAP